jgi:hypothetical protein
MMSGLIQEEYVSVTVDSQTCALSIGLLVHSPQHLVASFPELFDCLLVCLLAGMSPCNMVLR